MISRDEGLVPPVIPLMRSDAGPVPALEVSRPQLKFLMQSRKKTDFGFALHCTFNPNQGSIKFYIFCVIDFCCLLHENSCLNAQAIKALPPPPPSGLMTVGFFWLS